MHLKLARYRPAVSEMRRRAVCLRLLRISKFCVTLKTFPPKRQNIYTRLWRHLCHFQRCRWMLSGHGSGTQWIDSGPPKYTQEKHATLFLCSPQIPCDVPRQGDVNPQLSSVVLTFQTFLLSPYSRYEWCWFGYRSGPDVFRGISWLFCMFSEANVYATNYWCRIYLYVSMYGINSVVQTTPI